MPKIINGTSKEDGLPRPIPSEQKRRKAEIGLFCTVILLHVFKFSFFGFEYFPYLDDYVQYGLYPYLPNLWSEVLLGGPGIMFSRPAAVFFDTFIWGNFWNCLWVAMLIIAVLGGITSVLFRRFFERMDISVSPLFIVLFLFTPLSFEGTYWISASSRVVVSLFFLAASLHALLDYCEGKPRAFAAFAVINLISYGFYEQTIVLSFFMIVYVVISKKKWKALLPMVVNLALIASYYILFIGESNNNDRMNVVSPDALPAFSLTVLKEIYTIFVTQGGKIFTRGFWRGLEMIVGNGASGAVWGGVGVLLCASYAFFSGVKPLGKIRLKGLEINKLRYDLKRFGLEFLLAALLFFVPFIPFALSGNQWLNFRNLVPAAVGLALAIDAVFRLVVRNRRVQGILSAAVLALFLVINVSELADYHLIAETDYNLALELAEEYQRTGEETLYCEKPYIDYEAQNAAYHDHVVSQSDSGWGFSCTVRGITHKKNIVVKFLE